MNYHNITTDDMLNGTGLRTVLWVAGCSHHCPECQNPQTWDHCSGLLFDEAAEDELFEKVARPWISGITFSGGDPLHVSNRDTIARLIKKAKAIYPEKNIWLYTGFQLEHCSTEGFYFSDGNDDHSFFYDELSLIDVLVDGRFEQKTREADLATGYDPNWCGSSNQRVIDIKKTIEQGKIVLFS